MIVLGAMSLLLTIANVQLTCPERPPKSQKVRRQLAGQWFERGQRAVEAKRFEEAVGAYACSMKIVEHAFTAYNLALAAEKASDRETALEGYRRYLALSPDANDRAAVEEKIRLLERPPEAPPPPPVAAPAVAAPPPPPPEIDPPPPPPPAIAPAVPLEREEETNRLLPAGIITLGAGAAAGVAGIVLNVFARSRAGESRTAFANEEFARSDDLNGEARTLAYSSYATIGVGAAAVVAGALLLVFDR